MKQFLKKVFCLFVVMFVIQMLICVCLASELTEMVPFEYNLLPVVKEHSIIDSKVTSSLGFDLFEMQGNVYYLGRPLWINNQHFDIDITGLSGETTLHFENEFGESCDIHYFITNEEGKISHYELIKGYYFDVIVETYRGIQIIYTEREQKIIDTIKSYLSELPENLIQNVAIIKMVPFENTKNIAGVTKERQITLYKISKYDTRTQKNIIFHEIGHTFANRLMTKQIIDYSYTNYSQAALQDRQSVSHYAKKFTEENNRYSEDFADSIAFYFISSNFATKYPHRYEYINQIINL